MLGVEEGDNEGYALWVGDSKSGAMKEAHLNLPTLTRCPFQTLSVYLDWRPLEAVLDEVSLIEFR